MAAEKPLLLEDLLELLKTPEKIKDGYIEKLYDQWTSTYDKELGAENYIGPVVASLKMAEIYSDKGISILECAAGTGLVGVALKGQGFTNITAVDISQKSLDLSEKKGCYNKLVLTACGDKNMPFEDNSYDALMAISALGPGHIQPVALRDWVRIVKPGGFIVVTVREAYFELEYGPKLTKMIGDLIESGKLRQEAKTVIPNMWNNCNAYIYTLKVL